MTATTTPPDPTLIDLLRPLRRHWLVLLAIPLTAAAVALGVTFVLTPIFTARTTLLPPQQQQSAAASALANLGAIAGLAGAGVRSPVEQYVALLQSATVQDRLVEQFKLQTLYERKLRSDARRDLNAHVRISAGRKDGIIAVEVDDESPQRAANLANAHVDELRRLVGGLALSEAQQRRAFFQSQLDSTRLKLTDAQRALQATGFGTGALRAEPRAAAEQYARLRAEVMSADARLQVLRRTLVDGATEVQQAQQLLQTLRAQMTALEATEEAPRRNDSDYVSRYREFKYQETLFELFSRQYELARVDEAREGALIQVIDPAIPADRRSWPRRGLITALTGLAALVLTAAALVIRSQVRAGRTSAAQSI